MQIRRTPFRLKSFVHLCLVSYSHLEKWVSNITIEEQQSLNKLCIHFCHSYRRHMVEHQQEHQKETATRRWWWNTSIK